MARDSPPPAPPRGGLPPRPEPSIGLDEARENYADFLAELDRVVQSGRVLDNAEWTDYYKRGHDALQPLLQHLQWSEPGQGEELRRANEDLRTKLRLLEPQGPGPSPG